MQHVFKLLPGAARTTNMKGLPGSFINDNKKGYVLFALY